MWKTVSARPGDKKERSGPHAKEATRPREQRRDKVYRFTHAYSFLEGYRNVR